MISEDFSREKLWAESDEAIFADDFNTAVSFIEAFQKNLGVTFEQ